MDKEFISAIEQICEERGIAKEKVLETVEMAIAAAYKKEQGRKGQVVRAKLDLETGETKLFQVKMVVDETMLKLEKEEGDEEVSEEEGGTPGSTRAVRMNIWKKTRRVRTKKSDSIRRSMK